MNLIKKVFKKIKENVELRNYKTRGKAIIAFDFILIAFCTAYIVLRIKYVNNLIPFWFTQLWGDNMLAPKNFLYMLPLTALSAVLLGLLFEFLFRRYFVRYLKEVVIMFTTLLNIMLTYSTLRIIFIASSPFPPLIPPLVLSLFVPFIVAFALTSIALPRFIQFAFDKDIVTNPKIHQHPGMILQKASARGGGSFYALMFVLVALIFVGLPGRLLGFFISVLMLGALGFMDDYQNTHPKSSFKSLENPALRLLLLFSAVAVLVVSGVVIKTVGNSFAGILDFTKINFNFDGTYTTILMYIFTTLWIVWVLNLLSWSNGIDGQYCGIVGIASVFLCILALRFSPITLLYKQVAIMAAISAGIAFGFTKHTWYPSSIMWGFGATAAGIVISALSILINTKIMVSILFLLIPFLDASVTFMRRVIQKKSPLKGDRGHFHHLLLDRGWSVPKIAKFYWFTTFLFGLLGLLGSERYLIQTVLTVGGVVAFIIVLTNLRSLKKPQL